MAWIAPMHSEASPATPQKHALAPDTLNSPGQAASSAPATTANHMNKVITIVRLAPNRSAIQPKANAPARR